MAVGNIVVKAEGALLLASGATVNTESDMVTQANAAIAARLTTDLAVLKQALSNLGLSVTDLGIVYYFQPTDGSNQGLRKNGR